MTELLAWLMGMSTLPIGRPEEIRIHFLHVPQVYAAPFFLCSFAIVSGFSFWIYLKRRQLLGKRRWVLMFCRIIGLMVIIFLLCGPILRVVFHNTSQCALAFLLDNSKSMTLVDKRLSEESIQRSAKALGLTRSVEEKPTGEDRGKAINTNRIDIVKAIVGDYRKGLLRDFDRFSIKTYDFGSSLKSGPDKLDDSLSEWISQLDADEPETKFGMALEGVMEDLRGKALAGIVVLSDFSHNSGKNPSTILEKAGKRHIPVYLIGIGEPDTKDLQISFLAMRDVLFLEDPAPVTVKIRHWGYAGREIVLVVRDEEGEVARREVVLNKIGEQTETIKVISRTSGKFTYTVEVTPFADELSVENNSKKKDVLVIDERIRILWVETSPRWEYRFAKNLIRRDEKRFDAKVLLFESDPEVRGEKGLFLGEFPKTRKDLFGYHLVVIGDIEPARLSEEEMKMIHAYVSEEGGALIFLAGGTFGLHGWRGTPLEEVIPVTIPDEAKVASFEDEIANPVLQPLRAHVTESGIRHSLMFVSDDKEEQKEAWEEFLLIYRSVGAGKANPGALVLLETAEEEEPEPLIVYSRYGSGTVVYMGTDELWRWRYRPGPVAHDRFWGTMLQQTALARLLGESRRITLMLSKKELGVGEEQVITARVLGEDYMPSTDKTVTVAVALEREDGDDPEMSEIVLNSIGEGGLYERKYFPGRVGRHTISLTADEEKVSVVFRAVPPQLEYENPALDKERMAEWAKLAGGNVYDPWDLSNLSDEVVAKAKAARVRVEDELWDAPFWAFLFVIFAGTEWFIRKWNNLA